MRIAGWLFLGLAALLGMGVWAFRRLAAGGRRTAVAGPVARLAGRRAPRQARGYCSYPVYAKKTVW